MPLRFDATLKDLIAPQPADFAVAFGLPAEESVIALNVDLSTVSAATDVALGIGEPLRGIHDFNFQSGPDPGLPGRVHIYNAVLHSRFDVPVRSIVVLLRPKADLANLTGELAYGDGDCQIQFRYRVVRLWKQPVEPFLHGGVAVLPLATLCHLPDDRPLADALREVVQEIERRLATETSHAEAARLMTAAYILTGLRVRKEKLSAIFRGVGLMQESTAYDEILEEGMQLGRAQGELRRARRILLRQGRQRFGNPDARTEQELDAISDLDRLDRLTDAILKVESWQELLATE